MLNINAPEFSPAEFYTANELNELDEVDAQNELLADLELLEVGELAARSVDSFLQDLEEPPCMTLRSLETALFADSDALDYYPSSTARGARAPKHSPQASYSFSDAKRKQNMHKSYGRRKC